MNIEEHSAILSISCMWVRDRPCTRQLPVYNYKARLSDAVRVKYRCATRHYSEQNTNR